MGEVNDRAVEAVGDRRAGRAPCGVAGPEYEVMDDQLRASPEQAGQGCGGFVDVEPVLLVDPDPGQLLAPPRELVAAPGQFLLKAARFLHRPSLPSPTPRLAPPARAPPTRP